MHLFFSECIGQDAFSFLLKINLSVSTTQILVPVILTFSKRSAGKKKTRIVNNKQLYDIGFDK